MPDRQVALSPPLPQITAMLSQAPSTQAAACAAACPYKRVSLIRAFTTGWRGYLLVQARGSDYEPTFRSDQERTAYWLGHDAHGEYERDQLLRTQTNHQKEVRGLCPRNT